MADWWSCWIVSISPAILKSVELTLRSWINYGLQETMAPSHKQWLIPFAIQLVPAGCLLFGAFWLKESPRWLFTKDKREEAMKNL